MRLLDLYFEYKNYVSSISKYPKPIRYILIKVYKFRLKQKITSLIFSFNTIEDSLYNFVIILDFISNNLKMDISKLFNYSDYGIFTYSLTHSINPSDVKYGINASFLQQDNSFEINTRIIVDDQLISLVGVTYTIKTAPNKYERHNLRTMTRESDEYICEFIEKFIMFYSHKLFKIILN